MHAHANCGRLVVTVVVASACIGTTGVASACIGTVVVMVVAQ